jgi:hypothetical protein
MNLFIALKKNFDSLKILLIFFTIGLLASLASADTSNYTANYSNINSDSKKAKTGIEDAADDASGLLKSMGFFTVTPKTTSTFPYTNYFTACFKDNWEVYKVSGNSIFNPRIQAYNEVIISCIGWRGKVTLSAYGQCKYIGIKRVCARFSAPCENGNNRCCGSDSCGLPNSSSCPDCSQTQAYRICAYEDPPIPIDPNDNNYNLMPFHENTPAPPAVTGGDNLVAIGAVLLAAGLLVPGLGTGVMLIMLAGGIMDLIEVITSTINYVVIQNVGCIDVPLAPSPPPFFSPLVPPTPTPGILSICHYSPKYYIESAAQSDLLTAGYTQEQITQLQYKQISKSDDLCENGGELGSAKQYSTYENPSVRIYFSNPLSFCTANQSTYDVCVIGQALGLPDEIQIDNNGFLPVCTATVVNNCINFPSGRTAGGPYRTNYSLATSAALGISDNTPSDTTYVIVDPSLQTLTLKGIDDAEYIDSAIGNTVTIEDTNGLTRTFYISLNDAGDQVCVTDKTNSDSEKDLGCVERPLVMSPPIVTACATTSSCGYSGQDITAQSRMSVSLGTPAKNAIIGVDTVISNPEDSSSYLAPTAFCAQDDIVTSGNSSSNQAPCYIYGSQFSAYITDSDNQTPATTSNGTITPNIGGVDYTGGIQYSQGSYCRGATKICLSGYNNPDQVVVAKIIQIVNSDSGDTQLVVSDKISDRVIPPSNAALPLNTSTLFNSDTGYITGTTPITRVAYGFKEPSSGEYYENSVCSSNGNSCSEVSESYPSPTSCTCTNYTTSPTSTYACTLQGCEWAFEVADGGDKTTSYIGYTDGVNQYLLTENFGYGERPLNALEQGLCADIVQPTCSAIDSPGDNDGLATWPQTSSGQTATGTCVNGTATVDGNPPTRSCLFQDTGATLANGCPESLGIQFTSVSNACGANVPTWWPSEFLYAKNNFQGAIINHFNIIPELMSKISPTYNNSNQIKSTSNTYSPEQWVTTSYNSCKSYTNKIDISKTPRTRTDGDQEMLFITQSNWRKIWSNDWNGDGESNDLTWLLSSDTNYNGCYVYNVNSYVSASISNATIGLKICKSGTKVSFSLVNLMSNSNTSFANTSYVMQSNIVAYDRISTKSASDYHGLPQQTVVTNSVTGTTDTSYINHGFVVQTTGFSGSYDASVAKDPPEDFVVNNTAENITVKYAFSGAYYFQTSYKNSSGQTRHRDYYKFTNYNSGTISSTTNSFSSPSTAANGSCALSTYRNAVNYSGSINNASYFMYPTKTSYNSNQYSQNPYSTPYISSIYVYTAYDGGNADGSWPVQDACYMKASFSGYISGNSALNPHMFLWSSPTSYNICNN